MTEGLIHAELLAACSSLGYSDGGVYYREADCLETTKDLLRYLRKDNERHDVRLALGDAKVLKTDLLPLLQNYSDDEELSQLLVRLLMDLTNPVVLLFREELPEDKVTRRQFVQLLSHQQGYKEAFIDQKVWEVMSNRLKALLEIPKEDRDEDDSLLLERLLVLIRNVLWPPPTSDKSITDDDASVHDQLLWVMHLSGMAELLLYMTTSLAEHDFSLHLLEIISIMLREQDASCLGTTNLGCSDKDKEEDVCQLKKMLHTEALKRQAKRSSAPSRYSRFGGTYVMRNVKSISDKDLIVHRPLSEMSISFDRTKVPKKHNKDRVPLGEDTSTRRSPLAVRIFLQGFCKEFLAGSYNSIMSTVKDSLDRAHTQDQDETYYIWAMCFFMEFNRHHNFKVEFVTETLSIETFHYIQTHIENYFEMMKVEKKKALKWAKAMHKALRSYRELLATLAHMDKSPVEDVRESSRILKSRLFYVVEYREMMLLLLQNYDPLKMSLGYLKDAVETTHVFLKLLEGMCKQGRHILVQGKGKKAPKKKPKTAAAAAAAAGTSELSQEQLQDLWDELSAEVAAVVQEEGDNLPRMMPFDPLSEDPEDLQKEMAMRRISKHLREKEIPQAVSLMRAAREVWPDGNIFGPQESDHTQDFLSLQEIFMANLSVPTQESPTELPEEEEEEEEEREEERMIVSREQEFEFEPFVRRFANTKVVKAYSSLLHMYSTNTKNTNHYVLKLFHRLAWDCKLPAIFFQASLFTVFLKAMEDPLRSSDESTREIAKFGKYIMRQMYKIANENSKVFVELLFWKTNKEALEIECGYGEQESDRQASKQAWREEEEEELKVLYEEVVHIAAEDRGEKDTVELIMERLISRNRTRRSVIAKLKELGLIQNAKELKPRRAARISAPRTWTAEEEEELRRLFQENREAMDTVGRVMDAMTTRRPKHRVVEKILELGLVQDRKELRKKRAKKPNSKPSKRNNTAGHDFLRANESSDEDVRDVRDSESPSPSSSSESDSEDNLNTHHTTPPPPPVAATPALIHKALDVVLGDGRREAVEWLSRVLTDVADDREEDGDFEPVPILPLTDPCTSAMEDDEFQKLLRLVGLQAPLTHQEMFWRVPSRLSVVGLRKRAQYLSQGVSGGLQEVENPDEPLEDTEEDHRVQSNSRKVKRGKDTKTHRRKLKNDASKSSQKVPSSSVNSEDKENRPIGAPVHDGDGDDGDDDDGRNSVEGDSEEDSAPLPSLSVQSLSTPGSHTKRRLSDGDDGDDDDGDGDESIEQSRERKSVKERKKMKRLVVDSDSEEEEEEDRVCEEEKQEDKLESEEEDQQVSSQPNKKSRIRTIVDSDDDDDD